jgi:CRISPR-associated protein Csb1
MNESKKEQTQLSNELLDDWATNTKGPVALHMKQRLFAVEGEDGEDQIIYPPTYADIGYNIDQLSDGTRVALIDSVGSQANRLEPVFKIDSGNTLSTLVPQIDIVIRKEGCGECAECKKNKSKVDKCEKPWKEKRSLHDLAHRAADAVVQSSPVLQSRVAEAFDILRKTGNATPLCTIAPTSLLFGCWDSRGGSGEKRPRLVRAIIRAWDVEELHTAAQFNSVWKSLNEEQKGQLEKALPKGKKLSEKGFKDAPAVKYKDGRRILGGIMVRGVIRRDVTINLVALRGLSGGEQNDPLRRYLLALSILTATEDIELFLREGCNLRYADNGDQWYSVPRRGDKKPVDLVSDSARKLLLKYAENAYEPFKDMWNKTEWPEGSVQKNGTLEIEFNISKAKELLSKKTEDESGE